MKIIFLFTALLSFSALANPCRKDMESFCSDIKPGMGKMTSCLLDNRDKLSPACRKEVLTPISSVDQKNPCHDNLVEFCSEMPLQGEKLSYCLLKNETKLSRECAMDFKGKKETFLKNNPCAPDISEHCYTEVKGRQADIARCLIKKKEKLSPVCQKNVEQLTAKIRKQNSCFDEIEKHCANVQGPSLIQACLEKNKSSLGPKCVAAVEKHAAKIKSHPCHEDLNRLCKTALTPENKRKCLATYESKLSAACKAHQQSKSKKMNNLVSACEADRKKHCSYVPRKSQRVIRCLKLNKDKISAQCRSAL